jgi:hypothetical protein
MAAEGGAASRRAAVASVDRLDETSATSRQVAQVVTEAAGHAVGQQRRHEEADPDCDHEDADGGNRLCNLGDRARGDNFDPDAGDGQHGANLHRPQDPSDRRGNRAGRELEL